MSMTEKWDTFEHAVLEGAKALAKNTVKDAIDQAEADAKAFLNDSKESLLRWTESLAQGNITREEFEYLVEGQQDLAKMHALKAVGLSHIGLERFRRGLISLIVSSAFDAIGA